MLKMLLNSVIILFSLFYVYQVLYNEKYENAKFNKIFSLDYQLICLGFVFFFSLIKVIL